MKKYLIGISGLIIMYSIASCSLFHSNKLKTAETRDVGRFLQKASKYAETKIGVYNGLGSNYYGTCMKDNGDKHLCSELYSQMVQYAKTTRHFKTVTASDLTDRAMWKRARIQYEIATEDAI